jgi:hypothetical protein
MALYKCKTMEEAEETAISLTRVPAGYEGEGGRAYLLRPDGDTIIYENGTIIDDNCAGWITCGQNIDESDCPCVVQ